MYWIPIAIHLSQLEQLLSPIQIFPSTDLPPRNLAFIISMLCARFFVLRFVACVLRLRYCFNLETRTWANERAHTGANECTLVIFELRSIGVERAVDKATATLDIHKPYVSFYALIIMIIGRDNWRDEKRWQNKQGKQIGWKIMRRKAWAARPFQENQTKNAQLNRAQQRFYANSKRGQSASLLIS